MIFGADAACSMGIRFAPGTEAQPGVSEFGPVAVLGGIGIDQQPGGAVPLGRQRLEAAVAVGIRIAHDHDLAFHADAVLA